MVSGWPMEALRGPRNVLLQKSETVQRSSRVVFPPVWGGGPELGRGMGLSWRITTGQALPWHTLGTLWAHLAANLLIYKALRPIANPSEPLKRHPKALSKLDTQPR